MSSRDFVVLFNAQPFGFGPAASLDAILRHLRLQLDGFTGLSLQYVGSSLTLALNQPRSAKCTHGYDRVHQIDVYKDGGVDELTDLCKRVKPSLFVTVSDAIATDVMLGLGIPVILIDLLLWFWLDIPSPWRSVRQILAVDFCGVRERSEREGLTNVRIVPGIAPPVTKASAIMPREGVLLNLGGLRNPFVPAAEHVDYGQIIHRAARGAATQCNIPMLHVIASPEVAQGLGRDHARTVDPPTAQKLMQSTRLACITPGLGNLFEAAACAQSVLILPPSTESHGLQMRLLHQEGLLDQIIDWHDLVGGEPIDYARPQDVVLEEIQMAQNQLMTDPQAQGRLLALMINAMKRTETGTDTLNPLRQLIDRYGNQGARSMAEAIVDTIEELRGCERNEEGSQLCGN